MRAVPAIFCMLAALPPTPGWIKYLFLVGFFVLCCVFFHFWERRGPRVIPEHKPGPFHKGWFADFTAAVVHGPVLTAVSELVALTLILQVPALNAWRPLDQWPWWPAFIMYFIVNDLGRYWLHRLYHESDFLWRLHRVHHSATEMSVLTNFRMHFFEALPKYVILVLPFKLLDIDGWIIVIYSALDLAKGFWHHANVKTHVGPLNLVINSAEQHWWHHSVEARGQRANYGSVLSIWDRIFGTFYWPKGQWPDRIGVEGIEQFPTDYIGQLVSPLKADNEFQAAGQATTAAAAAQHCLRESSQQGEISPQVS